jgi:hypothetical protein
MPESLYPLHFLLSLPRKRRVMMEEVNVSTVREGWAGGDLPLLSSPRVVMHSSYQRGCHGKFGGKKKVIGKERRRKD